MNHDKPLISIITVCLNSEKTIEDKIEKHKDLEHTYNTFTYLCWTKIKVKNHSY